MSCKAIFVLFFVLRASGLAFNEMFSGLDAIAKDNQVRKEHRSNARHTNYHQGYFWILRHHVHRDEHPDVVSTAGNKGRGVGGHGYCIPGFFLLSFSCFFLFYYDAAFLSFVSCSSKFCLLLF